MYIYIE